MFIERKKLTTDFNVFLGIVISLIIIGFLFIYSSSSVFALERFGSAHYFVKKQLMGLLLGFLALVILQIIPLNLIHRCTPLLFVTSLGLTAITMIPGLSHHIHGSSRWLNIAGFSFQPSELLKISFILYLAYFLTKKAKHNYSFVYAYLPFLIVLAGTSFILLKQPDFGLTITLVATAFIMLFIAHFQTKHLLLTLSALIPAFIALIIFKPYRFKRILTFLNPWQDPQGAGFQIIQSLIAIGSGGLWGVGISHSKQKFFYLPMQHTDFIFSIIAEETGFVGSLVLITLYGTLLYSGMRLALQFRDSFCLFTTLGFIILTTMQTSINLAVATGLVPTKGLGLPFISYGNTALVCNMIMIGIIMLMVREHRT